MSIETMARLRGEITQAEIALRSLKGRLESAERACPHNRDATAWSAPVASQEPYKEAVIDWAATEHRGSDVYHHTKYVDATRKVFSRTCRFCGKTETTTATRAVATEVPAF